MAYTNKVTISAAVATMMLFLAVTIVDAQSMPPMPKFNPVCALADLPNIVQLCYFNLDLTPSEECCNDLKSSSTIQVNCLCDNFIAHPSNGNISQARYDLVNSACGVADKFACKGGDASGGSTNKIAASMVLLGLVASLFF
ncbi:Bifunctional inhibitor/plant lipid transfer protein/seed storage helical domain superfamily [Arabidopsis suecica]|uniref:Non-specific lipid transfer protein GPI-anchored 33 n=3 Tax=Arabidopsis TaxID=3701 RepID=LTG33_ARATH|nr:Bifunctional inhibitor/lipid-transfer protein/seed storage 2S albumin superfamily protein [Arabidopsis thaliana]O49645.1 RecName: Full=Non-specific lipid transfer protein GPI-anchored 33; Short=AtLTPG-33; Short=Protein LTP-GPI-ANCHORED 33; Flags: Precursor [Arabidopsis thaliana]KAG7621427.1 Bifunctional inhibitor/plant lipid transfer protein/seed storage helical domain superfamily [Arabidopsis suecica]ANM66157.1 Bifunctional inhibitor/lipid-transfer protein/seed storage 2S albumin superfamily|eukprot:NP_001328070.1 Bifunctional inhibitor/lipid-transfer protein/seed storage 2S albumin superfamily protein [Arabidopsis thaliana]